MNTLRSVTFGAGLALMVACSTTSVHEDRLDSDVKSAVQLFKEADTDIAALFKSAQGYAVFPKIGKGAIGVGGAHGFGEVFEHGVWIGDAEMTQVTVGAQLGGQSYAEVIFFETQATLDDFKAGKLAMSAQLSAVAAAAGASANAKYDHGVLVFTIANSGLMFEASAGGQKFTYTPRGAR